jgi:peptide/nickel transport system ATP-binding protein
MTQALLDVRGVTKVFGGGFLQSANRVVALDSVHLTIPKKPATIVAVAGESGSGKTTLGKLVLGSLKPTHGQILYEGQNIADRQGSQLLEYRRKVQAIFQDPYEVFNPFYKVDHTFRLVIRHFRLADDGGGAEEAIRTALNMTGLRPEDVLGKYPHQLSGGQRQRIMIARALMLRPRLVLADEPVSMVDASLRAMILDIMQRMRREQFISFLYITHDLSTAYQISDRIYILYRGCVVEQGETTKVIENPQHPYLKLLIDSVPIPDPNRRWDTRILLDGDGSGDERKGCPFYSRCPVRATRCLTERPPLRLVEGENHQVRCYL